jgi:hypothetical protein
MKDLAWYLPVWYLPLGVVVYVALLPLLSLAFGTNVSRQCDLCGCMSTECKPFLCAKSSSDFVCHNCRKRERDLG